MRRLAMIVIGLALATSGCSRSVHQKDFATAEAATDALISAARSDDPRALLRVLGPEAEELVYSGDPVQDRNARAQFVRAYDGQHSLVKSADGSTILHVGADEWPFPFPLVHNNGRWQFNGEGGSQEIINRRVGANELSTIQSCLAFVDAEREYYVRNPQREPLLQYAKLLVSSPGKKDGLYWPTSGSERESPLGPHFARARSEGYFSQTPGKGEPFRGYVYRLLTAQGANATGGAYDYMVGDKLFGGFALIAFPVDYGSSGVMTFIVSHDGIVYSKDLGPDTSSLALKIKTFDPDDSWRPEAAIESHLLRSSADGPQAR